MFFGQGGSNTAQLAATAVSAFWYGLRTVIANDYQMVVDPEVFSIDQATGEPTSVESTTQDSVTGANTAEPLPWVSQGLLRWHTGVFVGGREVRGRTFIPAPTTDDNTGGVPNSTYLGVLNTAGAALISATNVTLLTYSRQHHTSFAVISRSPWTKWAELRSRRD